jgi:hypothetical protein
MPLQRASCVALSGGMGRSPTIGAHHIEESLMTAIVLPNIDEATLNDLRKRIPNLSEIELPKLEGVGKTAEETIDRLLGRSKPSIWPWVAASIGLVAVISAIGAYFAWFRRSTLPEPPVEDAWTNEPGPATTDALSDEA